MVPSMDRLSELLQRVLGESDPDMALEAGVRSVWSKVAGPLISRNARPLRVRGAVLFLETSSAAWAQELTFMREELRTRICAILGDGRVAEIRVEASHFVRKDEPVVRTETKMPDAVPEVEVPIAIPSAIQDPELLDAVQRARRALHRRSSSR